MVKTFPRPWLTPLVVLIILLLAFAFRWDYNASKTYDWGVVKWKTDRWDGRKWAEVYEVMTSNGQSNSFVYEVPYDREGNLLKGDLRRSAYKKRNLATAVWGTSVIGASIWLILVNRRQQKSYK